MLFLIPGVTIADTSPNNMVIVSHENCERSVESEVETTVSFKSSRDTHSEHLM